MPRLHPEDYWRNHKEVVLSKRDKSFKGDVDAPIVDLVNCINSSQELLTTSSCSGRIMLVHEKGDGARKNNASFVFVSHTYVTDEAIVEMYDLGRKFTEGHLFLKLEPVIIHIECLNLQIAIDLLHRMKRESAFKHSCIVSATNSKYIVCVKGVVKLEVPVCYDGNWICSKEMLDSYVGIANKRMGENFRAIDGLGVLFRDGSLPIPSSLVKPSAVDYDISQPVLVEQESSIVNGLVGVEWRNVDVNAESFTIMAQSIGFANGIKSVATEDQEGDSTIGIVPDKTHGFPSVELEILCSTLSESSVLFDFKDRASCTTLWVLCAKRRRDKKGARYMWKKVSVGDGILDALTVFKISPLTLDSFDQIVLLESPSNNAYAIEWRPI